MSFNVLITSLSRKVPLIKAVRHARDRLHLHGKVIGGDVDPNCIGRNFVDDFWQMAQQKDLSIHNLLDNCKRHNIHAIIPTRDAELPFFAKHREVLTENHIACLTSDIKPIEICRDKLLFASSLVELFPIIPTDLTIDLLEPASAYVVKEQFGAGSRTIGLNLTSSEAKQWASNLESPIFQPYIEGKEYSVDLYIDRSKKVNGVIARSRDVIIGGESQVTSSLKDKAMEDLCIAVAEHLELYGHAVFQLIRSADNKLHLIECNPRFGGASTLSLAMGLDSFHWFFCESLQKPLSTFIRSKTEKRQIRYAEDLIIDLS